MALGTKCAGIQDHPNVPDYVEPRLHTHALHVTEQWRISLHRTVAYITEQWRISQNSGVYHCIELAVE